MPDNRVESVPDITTVAEYADQSAIRVAATQLGPRYSSSDAKRIVAEWVEFFASGPSQIQDLQFVSRTPKRLFDALAGQPQLQRLSVKWGDFDDLSALSKLTEPVVPSTRRRFERPGPASTCRTVGSSRA